MCVLVDYIQKSVLGNMCVGKLTQLEAADRSREGKPSLMGGQQIYELNLPFLYRLLLLYQKQLQTNMLIVNLLLMFVIVLD